VLVTYSVKKARDSSLLDESEEGGILCYGKQVGASGEGVLRLSKR
jgi:hypothetical protein